MALEERIDPVSAHAAGPIGQFLLLTYSTTRPRTVAVAGVGGKVAGVSRNKVAAAGQAVTVIRGGIARVKAGGAVSPGQEVASDADGRAVAGTTNPAGRAITGAGAAGEIIEVDLYR